MSKQRDAQLQVLKGLRDLETYIALLEMEADLENEGLYDLIDKHGITKESIDLGKASLDHSIKGLTNEINK